ncbi:MAG: hypothetical protein JJU06_09540 [Ectothiorhodospiraceae bacterium]|nr:hypothetical protein [Ectothiorhodospiraceae bacterium]MCH8503137.1 hypothetical protein [Ectothiorhodospiraceae bacterium]
MLFTQTLIVVTLIGLGVYYRRNRLRLLVEPSQRQARGVLGVAGVLVLTMAWALVGGMLDHHGHLLASMNTVMVSFFGVPILAVLGLAMIVWAARARFEQVIAFLDFLTGYTHTRR